MAEVVKAIVPLNGAVAVPDAILCGAGGATVKYDAKDTNILLVVYDAEATIKAGNGMQGVSDLVIPHVPSKASCVVVESGKYVNVDGLNKGKIVVKGASAKVLALVLP